MLWVNIKFNRSQLLLLSSLTEIFYVQFLFLYILLFNMLLHVFDVWFYVIQPQGEDVDVKRDDLSRALMVCNLLKVASLCLLF